MILRGTFRRCRRKAGLTRKPGFTLVELLVVIGIIALLISILLPALSAARRQANKVKCMSQLREIGNALALYSTESKGWWPVVRHEASTTFPPSNVYLQSNPARNDYWYMFLLKYFSRKGYTNVAGQRLADYVNTPLWGCPSAEKLDADISNSSSDFNSGYGMGPYADYGDTKWLGANSSPAGIIKGSHWAMISSSSGGLEGRYFKQSAWRNGARKCIIADARSWFMETRSVTGTGANLGITDPVGTGALGYDGAASHQWDKWRHSKKKGGTNSISFNMLFCDGHVGEVTDIKEAFKAVRGHFPL